MKPLMTKDDMLTTLTRFEGSVVPMENVVKFARMVIEETERACADGREGEYETAITCISFE